MQAEPVRLASMVSAALTATVSLLAFVGVSSELIAGINVAIAAWLVVVFHVVRNRVDSPRTSAAKERAIDGMRTRLAGRELTSTAA
jgi:hypothetical protein